VRITVSAGSDFNSTTDTLGIQSNTFDIWGVQVEAGSVATAFQTATGTLQGELSACQRYYFRFSVDGTDSFSIGYAGSVNTAQGVIPFPVSMRAEPSALEQSGTAADYSLVTAAGVQVCTAVPTYFTGNRLAGAVNFTATGLLVAGQGLRIRPVNVDAFLGWSAEL
jgi:hypothetical protein